MAAREAIGNLFEIYRPPLTEYLVRNRMLTQAEADDAFQGFVLDRILEKDFLRRFRREAGKFRTFILTSLRNYAEDCRRKKKETAAGDASFADAPLLPPLDAFQVEFAQKVVQEVLDRMKSWYLDRNRPEVWRLFEAVVLRPARDGRAAPDYTTLVGELGFASAPEAYNALANAKRTAMRILRNVVGEYEAADVEEEISQLRDILLNSRSGLGEFLSGIRSDPDLAEALRKRLEGETGRLLLDKDPDLRRLESLKNASRPDKARDETPLPVLEVLYYGAIAAALAGQGERITRLTDGDLRLGFEQILSRPWLPESMGELFRSALGSLG
jgi:hypothetical protein